MFDTRGAKAQSSRELDAMFVAGRQVPYFVRGRAGVLDEWDPVDRGRLVRTDALRSHDAIWPKPEGRQSSVQ